eukprot:GHVU01130390.1.p4 GENE.GHVU01130390.1~~GHVU01130390.1.p4  ORF type:complete len:101 (-),score=17.29 GHVU01130390.1:94-396(-)
MRRDQDEIQVIEQVQDPDEAVELGADDDVLAVELADGDCGAVAVFQACDAVRTLLQPAGLDEDAGGGEGDGDVSQKAHHAAGHSKLLYRSVPRQDVLPRR